MIDETGAGDTTRGNTTGGSGTGGGLPDIVRCLAPDRPPSSRRKGFSSAPSATTTPAALPDDGQSVSRMGQTRRLELARIAPRDVGE